jgi:aminopeptidase-like protein
MKKITILTNSSHFPAIREGSVGILIEYAMDSDIGRKYPNAITINELIGDPQITYAPACELVNKILCNEPVLRGVPQLTIFQEQVNWEMHNIYRLLHLHQFLMKHKFEICEFISPSWWSTELPKLVNLLKSPLTVTAPRIKKQNKFQKGLHRIFSGKLSLKIIFSEFRNFLDQVDPFHRRSMLFRKIKNNTEKDKCWYYTTAVTFTNISLIYEPYFPEQFHFLVENSETGGKPLKERKRKFASIYDYAVSRFIPSNNEISAAIKTIRQHILHVHLNEQDSIARRIFLDSSWLSLFFSKHLAKGLYSSSLFEHWLDQVRPSALIVGNPVFEGYALYKARDKKIPTILLQHGILGGCYFYYDHPVDYYIMRGEFWRESLSLSSQQRAVVLNPHINLSKQNVASTKNSIVFITTPLHMFYMPVAIDLESIYRSLIRSVNQLSVDLVIRVHPLERIVDFQNIMNKISNELSVKIAIKYDQGGDLDALLERALAVIMVKSTVFLDCIKHNVPVISFDWCDYWFKERIKSYNIFHFTKNLADFEQTVIEAGCGNLKASMNNPELILGKTHEREIESTVAAMVTKKFILKKSSDAEEMYKLVSRLFPICRSITGKGVRQTLNILKEFLPNLTTNEVPSGTNCFDWTVPDEWNINDAYVKGSDGNKIIDFKISNLHVLNYSEPIHQKMNLEELNEHLYSLPELPEAIPYVTSYYQRRWGFCLTDNQRKKLLPGEYEVFIDSTLEPGSLTYGELIIPGELKQEILLSTYICHPSLANNELSGPVVTTFLAKWLLSLKKRKYTYRIIFIPETIGSIVYLSKHYQYLKKHVYAGFNISCIGDDHTYSYLPSRKGNTISDRIAKHVLKHIFPDYKNYTYRQRGSDERQYCSPGIDLPIASLMRSKYGEYPEYHTSLDNLDFVTPTGLMNGYRALLRCLECLEANDVLLTQCYCEPQLGKRGLYPTIGLRSSDKQRRDMMDILAYCDGEHDLLEIAEMIDTPLWEMTSIIKMLIDNQLIKNISSSTETLHCIVENEKSS